MIKFFPDWSLGMRSWSCWNFHCFQRFLRLYTWGHSWSFTFFPFHVYPRGAICFVDFVSDEKIGVNNHTENKIWPWNFDEISILFCIKNLNNVEESDFVLIPFFLQKAFSSCSVFRSSETTSRAFMWRDLIEEHKNRPSYHEFTSSYIYHDISQEWILMTLLQQS